MTSDTYQLRIGPTEPDRATMRKGPLLWVDTSVEPHAIRCWHPEEPDHWHTVVADPAELSVTLPAPLPKKPTKV